ncbi:MAG TPA: glucose-6-phosphate dehydrogenase [Pirellulales bacterium]|nr:glucose-6-phosphate dehydrogenase [Pirellulales bacterium]
MPTAQIIRAHGPAIKTAPKMVASAAAQEPAVLVLFGATGDLSGRKILPALFALWQGKFLPDQLAIVGVAIEKNTDDQFRDLARKAVESHGRLKPANDDEWNQFAALLQYQSVDFGNTESYASLSQRITGIESQRHMPGNRLFYLAISPTFFASVIDQLSAQGLIHRYSPGTPWYRVVIEKPFGHDLASARALDADIHRFMQEDQIYRIDHYLGKETVLNMMAFRFANAIFEPLLNCEFVDHVQITVAETVGMEGHRGSYYDTAGAIRDVMQNHVLQLLAYAAMDAPGGLKGVNVRTEKLRVLRNLVPITSNSVDKMTVRGQYSAGTVDGQRVPAYRDEFGVAKDSKTETYVALRTQVDLWRWAGVPFLLRTGKRLPKRATEIAIRFKDRPLRHTPSMEVEMDGVGAINQEPNVLVFRIQPDEGISLSFVTKQPGMGFSLQPVRMEFDYEHAFHIGLPEAYERLLLDAIKGIPLLFMRSDEVDAQWEFITPIIEAWQKQSPPGFPNYEAGSWGPKDADKLVADRQGKWRDP